ncbi:hypothetical protein UlMin_004453 [Ulmus minor]
MVAGLHHLFFKAARAYHHLEFEKYMSEMSSLNPKIKDYLLEIGLGRYNIQTSNIAESINSTTNTFNVKYNQKTFFVDLEKRTCTCRQFDLDEIPCSHAITGIDKLYQNKYEYCSKWYDIMMYKNTYNGSLSPIGDKEDWNIPEDIKQEILLPPIYKPAAGRRKKQRYKSAT